MNLTNTLMAGQRLAAAFTMLAALSTLSFAQSREILLHVHCSNVGNTEGEARIDSPRRIEVVISYVDSNGDPQTEMVHANLPKGTTARAAATMISDKVNGKGTDPTEKCKIESTDPTSGDWVDREHEIKLTLPQGVTADSTYVKKLKKNKKEWEETGDCNSHISAKILNKDTIAGAGLIELQRDELDAFGLIFEVSATTGDGLPVEFAFEQFYPEGTPSVFAMTDLTQALNTAGFMTSQDGASLWIFAAPWSENITVAHAAWVDDSPQDDDTTDDSDDSDIEAYWSGAGTAFTPLAF